MLTKFQEQAKAIYEKIMELDPIIKELARLNVPLDHDPVSRGLASLNKKISDIQKAKDYICSISLETIRLKNQAENLSTRFEKFFSERKSQVMKGNETYYASLKTQAMRDLALEENLKDESTLQSKLVQLVNIAKSHQSSTQVYLTNLESTNNNLKYQFKVIEDMIAIGEIESKFSHRGID